MWGKSLGSAEGGPHLGCSASVGHATGQWHRHRAGGQEPYASPSLAPRALTGPRAGCVVPQPRGLEQLSSRLELGAKEAMGDGRQWLVVSVGARRETQKVVRTTGPQAHRVPPRDQVGRGGACGAAAGVSGGRGPRGRAGAE